MRSRPQRRSSAHRLRSPGSFARRRWSPSCLPCCTCGTKTLVDLLASSLLLGSGGPSRHGASADCAIDGQARWRIDRSAVANRPWAFDQQCRRNRLGAHRRRMGAAHRSVAAEGGLSAEAASAGDRRRGSADLLDGPDRLSGNHLGLARNKRPSPRTSGRAAMAAPRPHGKELIETIVPQRLLLPCTRLPEVGPPNLVR